MAPPKKPWRYYFVMVFPNSTKITTEELKSMVTKTQEIEEKELAFLSNIAAKHPRNNLPPILSPFIGVYQSFLRHTTGLSLLCLMGIAAGMVYLRYLSPYSIYTSRLMMALTALIILLLGVTPFLGYRGAATRNWIYLKSFDRALMCFFVVLILGIYLLELFQRDLENAAMTYSNATNRYEVYRPSLFTNDSNTAPVKISSFVQAEFGKELLMYLQDQFETMFPNLPSMNSTNSTPAITFPPVVVNLNNTASSSNGTDDHSFSISNPLPWLKYRTDKFFNPDPVKETPLWMKSWVQSRCSNDSIVNATRLDGQVQVALEPTFASCLRPILYTLLDIAYALQLIFVSLAALLILQWFALVMLKWLDPTCPTEATTSTKKGSVSTGSFVHLLHLVLIIIGFCMLVLSAFLLYAVFVNITEMSDDPVSTEQIIVWVGTTAFVVYSCAITLAGFLGCSPSLCRGQTKALALVLLLQFTSCIVLYVIHTDIDLIIQQALKDNGRWDESYVNSALQYVFDTFEHSKSTILLDFLENECQISMAKITDITQECKSTVASMLNDYILVLLWACLSLLSLEALLILKNMYYLWFRSYWRKLVGKKSGTKTSKHRKTKQIEETSDSMKEETLTFDAAVQKYLLSYPQGQGKSDEIARAKQAFTEQWLYRVGASVVHDTDVLFKSQFESIVRVLILQRLTCICGLEVSIMISKDGKLLYFKISASRRVISQEAESRKYKLPFKNAVDPGFDFWTAREISIDNRVYDAQTAKQKLCSLYGRALMLATENQFFKNESMQQISKRVNVHMRDAELQCPSGKVKRQRLPFPYPTYAPYYKKHSIQYLYQRHPNQLDLPTVDISPSVFQTTDILRLVDAMIHDEIDTTGMIEAGLLESYSCLHTASRFEWTNLNSLRAQWLTYWRPRQLPGEPDPDTQYFRNFFYRIYPFRQPLTAVREYFGEQIALYYTWLGFYAQCLMIPVVCSFLYVVWHKGNVHGYTTSIVTNGTTHVECYLDDTYLGISILVWAFGYAKFWQRKQHLCTVAWGMDGLVEEQQVRVEFYGEERINPITNEVERHFPQHLRAQLQVASMVAVFAILCGYYAIMIFIYSFQATLVQSTGQFWGTTITSILQVAFMNQCAKRTSKIAYWLNDKENYQTEGEYENHVILKIFLIQGIIYYSALLYTAFFKHSTLGCYDVSATLFFEISAPDALDYGSNSNCLPEVESLLLFIFLWRMFHNCLQIAIPLLQYLRDLASKPDVVDELEQELALDTYENVYEDYAEIVIQFGLLVLFIFAAPIAPILAFIESAIQLRLDAFHLCYTYRRPLPRPAEDIGTWFTYIMLLSRVCIVTNLGFLFFTASNYDNYMPHERMTLYLLTVAVGLALFELFWLYIPGTPALKQVLLDRHEYLRQKYLYNATLSNATPQSTPDKINTTTKEILDSVQAYSADTFQALHDRAELLEKFNQLFQTKPPKESSAVLTHRGSLQQSESTLEPLDLSGIEAIREAVRRSETSFLNDDTPDWYFSDVALPSIAPPPWTRREPALTQNRAAAISFMEEEAEEDAEQEEEDNEDYIFDEDDENLGDVL